MRIDGTRVFLAAAATAWIWAAGAAQADDSVVWNWDETTTGQDILWTSPTSIDPGVFGDTFQKFMGFASGGSGLGVRAPFSRE